MQRASATMFGLLILLAPFAVGADGPAKRTPKEALQSFQDLIGSWKGTGDPEGTREEKQRGFWEEKLSWEWQFKDKDVWLEAAFDKGKYFDKVELRYLPDKDLYQLTAHTTGKDKLTFEGPLKNKLLTLERTDDKTKETQRLVISLLHANRFLYRYEVKPAGRSLFTRLYQVGATKEGVPFAGASDSYPECIVSGGRGTMAVSYKGQTYYVCCSGCRRAFNDEPEKYLKEYEDKKAKGKGK